MPYWGGADSEYEALCADSQFVKTNSKLTTIAADQLAVFLQCLLARVHVSQIPFAECPYLTFGQHHCCSPTLDSIDRQTVFLRCLPQCRSK